jgi:membrane protein required for colicin V production
LISSIDIILIVALIAFAVHGFSKGLMNKLLSLGALIVGIVITARYSRRIALIMQGFLGTSEIVSGVIGIVLLFVLLFVVANLLGKLFKKITIFKVWDKFGGAIFGAVEGGILLSLILLFLALFSIPARGPSLERSYLYKPVKNFAGLVYATFMSRTSTEKYFDKFFNAGEADKKDSTTRK